MFASHLRMGAAISLPICFASTSTPPGSEWAQLHEQMDPDPVVLRFSPDEWNKLASGLLLSPDDLRMIEAGLELLENSQIQLADLAKAEHRTDNIADALEDWAKKIGEPSQDSRAPQLMPSETDGSSGTRD
jgi:hypothetical protein